MNIKNLICIPLIALFLTGCWVTQEGNKVGIITKLAKQGAFIGTWEGQIIRGGFNNGSGTMGAPFDFTVENKNVLENLQKAMDEGREVKIYYHKEAVAWIRSESDNYFVDRVEIVNTTHNPVMVPIE